MLEEFEQTVLKMELLVVNRIPTGFYWCYQKCLYV
jgi:hypothetical protein